MVMNDGEALVAAAAGGMGLIQAPLCMVAAELHAGRVVEVLERFRPRPLPISLVYPSHRKVPARVRALIESFTPERVAAAIDRHDVPAARRRSSGKPASIGIR